MNSAKLSKNTYQSSQKSSTSLATTGLSPSKNYEETHFKNIIDKYANIHNKKNDWDGTSSGHHSNNVSTSHNNHSVTTLKNSYANATSVSDNQYGCYYDGNSSNQGMLYFNGNQNNFPHSNQQQNMNGGQQFINLQNNDNHLTNSAVYSGEQSVKNKLKNEVKVSSP